VAPAIKMTAVETALNFDNLIIGFIVLCESSCINKNASLSDNKELSHDFAQGLLSGRGRPGRLALLDALVLFDFAVAQTDDAVGMLRDVRFVGHQDDGIAFAMKPRKKCHDFLAGLRIEVSGRLVGQ